MKEVGQTGPENPYEHFDVSQFPSILPNPDEIDRVQAINEGMYHDVSDRFPDFTYPAPPGEDTIKLEHRNPDGGITDITMYESGRLGIWHWANPAVTESPDVYTYEQYPDGTFYRYDNPPEIKDTGSTRGTMSLSMKMRQMTKISNAEASNRQLEQDMGVAHITGSNEMSYVAGLVEQSEPATVGAVKLHTVVQNRSGNPFQPSEREAEAAAPLFKKSMHDFLQSNDPDTESGTSMLTGRVDNGEDENFSLEYGVSEVDGVPSFELWASHVLQPGERATLRDGTGAPTRIEGVKFEDVAQYTLDGSKMVTNHFYRVYNQDGRLEETIQRHAANAETTDVRDIRHFLHKPLLSRTDG
jgi:hypothetical protein